VEIIAISSVGTRSKHFGNVGRLPGDRGGSLAHPDEFVVESVNDSTLFRKLYDERRSRHLG
jgi:hypothetical protein